MDTIILSCFAVLQTKRKVGVTWTRKFNPSLCSGSDVSGKEADVNVTTSISGPSSLNDNGYIIMRSKFKIPEKYKTPSTRNGQAIFNLNRARFSIEMTRVNNALMNVMTTTMNRIYPELTCQNFTFLVSETVFEH